MIGRDLLPLHEAVAREPGRFADLAARLAERPFLRSDGFAWSVGRPRTITPALMEQMRELVARTHRLYLGILERFRPGVDEERFFVNELFRPAVVQALPCATPFPLSRLDCVLTERGELKVIELNPVGVTVHGILMSYYLARHLGKLPGLEAYADQLRAPARAMAASVRDLHGAEADSQPMVGYLYLGAMGRVSRLLRREIFSRAGMGFVDGHLEDLAWPRASDGDTRPTLRGQPIDVLWADSLFYNAYQEARYRHTTWASKMRGDYSTTPELVRPLVTDLDRMRSLAPRRDGSATLLTPLPAYLAISKGHLGRRALDDLGLPSDERAWVARHVADTYALDDRRAGGIEQRHVIAERGAFVLKPCMYGGAHGVEVGLECAAERWRERVTATWDDPEWVLQAYHPPLCDEDGNFLSLGLYNFNGVFGGLVVRGAPRQVVSVRNSALVPVAAQCQ